jgi:hypothetical protein
MSENLHLVLSKPPEAISDDEYNRWYDFHLGELLVVPGFVSARRYRLQTVKDPMPVRTTPPFRADHAGSLLRPRALLQAREDAARGTISSGDLRAIEDAAIRDAVTVQADTGLRSVTDGEFRRASWHMDFIYEIVGVQKAEQNRLRGRGPAAGRPRLHLPSARRHQPGVPQRPGAARRDRPARRGCRAPARDLHQVHQPGAAGQARRDDGHDAHVPRQLPLVVGGPGRL